MSDGTQDPELRDQLSQLEQRKVEDDMLLNALPVMFWYKDTENRLLRINAPAAKLEGLPVSFLENKKAEDLYPPEEAAAFYEDDLEVINSRQPKLGILEKHTTGMGEERWVETNKVPVFDDAGNVTGVIAMAIDVTEHQQKVQSATEQLQKLKSAIQDGGDPAALTGDIDAIISTLNA